MDSVGQEALGGARGKSAASLASAISKCFFGSRRARTNGRASRADRLPFVLGASAVAGRRRLPVRASGGRAAQGDVEGVRAGDAEGREHARAAVGLQVYEAGEAIEGHRRIARVQRRDSDRRGESRLDCKQVEQVMHLEGDKATEQEHGKQEFRRQATK